MSGSTWECTRCQARRYGQPADKLPSGWEWRLVYSSVDEKRHIPARFDARCAKCVAKEPPPKKHLSPPREPPRDPW